MLKVVCWMSLAGMSFPTKISAILSSGCMELYGKYLVFPRCFTIAVGHRTVNGDDGAQSKMPRMVNSAKRCTVPSTVTTVNVTVFFTVPAPSNGVHQR